MHEIAEHAGPTYWALQALHHLPDRVCAMDGDGRILMANRAMSMACGYGSSEALISRTVFELFPAETAAVMRTLDLQVLSTGQAALDQEQEVIGTNGRRTWIKTSRVPLKDDSGRIVGLVCTARDITDTKESDELLLAQANLLDMIAQSATMSEIFKQIIAVVEKHLPSSRAAIQLISPEGHDLLRPTALALPEAVLNALHPATTRWTRALFTAAETGESLVAADILADSRFDDAEVLGAAGISAVWVEPVFSLEGRALGVLVLFLPTVAAPTTVQSDVLAMATHMVSAALERQQAEERNKFLASHDALTGLPNRTTFERNLSDALAAAQLSPCQIGLAFFDLDKFKLINDSLGHAAGDTLLKAVAERARRSIRSGDVVARIGGDEFVMYLDHLSHDDDVNQGRFQHIRAAISAPVTLDGHTIQVTCSMGVAYFPQHANDPSALIANADAAMYRAKKFGRDNIQFFDHDQSNFGAGQLTLHTDLREAVARQDFVLHYQPQIDLRTRAIFSVESLVRWKHSTLGLLPPASFISAAEETGLIIGLGDWILNEACRQNKHWQDAGLPAIVVSVNVSARQFLEPGMVARVVAALENSGLDARYLELELTESLVMQQGAMTKMRELQSLGIHLAIDDFGTGYSSLSAIKRFPVSRLKIDRSFICDISTDAKDQAITSAIIALADKLQMHVLAEGVETAEQVELLRSLGCNEVQGYFFSRPVEAADISRLLAVQSSAA